MSSKGAILLTREPKARRSLAAGKIVIIKIASWLPAEGAIFTFDVQTRVITAQSIITKENKKQLNKNTCTEKSNVNM